MKGKWTVVLVNGRVINFEWDNEKGKKSSKKRAHCCRSTAKQPAWTSK